MLVRPPADRPLLDDIYRLAEDFAEIVSDPPAEARVIDLRDFAFDPTFRGVSMIDYFLRRLGLDPAEVPTALKRNEWLAPRMAPLKAGALPVGTILVCPLASMALRDMPDDVHRRILRQLLRVQPHGVATQGACQPDPRVIGVPRLESFAQLCALVASAAAVISTDTAIVHLADAFSIPCLGFFTTHRPEWRIRDYPLARGLYLPPLELPDALEFSRGTQDLASIAAAWRRGAEAIEAGVATFAHDVRL